MLGCNWSPNFYLQHSSCMDIVWISIGKSSRFITLRKILIIDESKKQMKKCSLALRKACLILALVSSNVMKWMELFHWSIKEPMKSLKMIDVIYDLFLDSTRLSKVFKFFHWSTNQRSSQSTKMKTLLMRVEVYTSPFFDSRTS